MEGQNYRFELQTEDMKLAFWWVKVPKMVESPIWAPQLSVELRLESSDKDSRNEKN